VAERQLPKLNVAGSIPVSRSTDGMPVRNKRALPRRNPGAKCPIVRRLTMQNEPVVP
jgi:hypothetical protein